MHTIIWWRVPALFLMQSSETNKQVYSSWTLFFVYVYYACYLLANSSETYYE